MPLIPAGHALLDPIAAIQRFYLDVLALARGRNPDRPQSLRKLPRRADFCADFLR